MRPIVFLIILLLFSPQISWSENKLPEVSDKAAEFRGLLLSGKIKDLSFYLEDFLSARTVSKDGAHFLTAALEKMFSRKASQQEQDALNSWVDQEGTSAWAKILRAYYFINQLERFPPEEFRRDKLDPIVIKLINNAAYDAEQAVRLARDNVCARYAHFKIARFQNLTADYEKRFTVVLKLYPQHFQAFLERLKQLSPQWGGSIKDVLNFSKQTALSYDKGSVLKSLPLFAHKLISEHTKEPKKYLSRKNVLEEIQNAERFASDAFPTSNFFLIEFSKLALKAGLIELSDRAKFQAKDRE